MRKTLVAVALLAVSLTNPFAQSKRAVTFDDVLNVKAVGGATISPDGAQVLYTVRQWVAEKDRMEARTHIWIVPTSGATPARQLTSGEKGDTQPQWSPDGRYISFVSARGAGEEVKAQVHVMRADGGEAWKLTDSKENVSSYSWSPDSTRIAYVAIDPRSAEEEANIRKRDDERVFEGDFRYAHIWVVDVDQSRHAHHRRQDLHRGWRAVLGARRQALRVRRRRHAHAARQPPRYLPGQSRAEAGREDQHQLRQRHLAALVTRRQVDCLDVGTVHRRAAA
ncbi:MAG: DPP IV N-terminal domain-containing protein [Acidobacteriota bacterium]|nr:DPP IV N-terminal domain-containing protein [Acidobacteriota bacterium]